MMRHVALIALLTAGCGMPERPGPTLALQIDAGIVDAQLRDEIRQGAHAWRGIGYRTSDIDGVGDSDTVIVIDLEVGDLDGRWGRALRGAGLITLDLDAIGDDRGWGAVTFAVAHEIGHVLGLSHLPAGVDGVMVDGASGGAASLWLTEADRDLACRQIERCEAY